jgi:hypothetical protein
MAMLALFAPIAAQPEKPVRSGVIIKITADNFFIFFLPKKYN